MKTKVNIIVCGKCRCCRDSDRVSPDFSIESCHLSSLYQNSCLPPPFHDHALGLGKLDFSLDDRLYSLLLSCQSREIHGAVGHLAHVIVVAPHHRSWGYMCRRQLLVVYVDHPLVHSVGPVEVDVDHRAVVLADCCVVCLCHCPNWVFALPAEVVEVCDHRVLAVYHSLLVLVQHLAGLCLEGHIFDRRFARRGVAARAQSIHRWDLHPLYHLVAQVAKLVFDRVRFDGPVRGSLRNVECPLRALGGVAP